MEQFSVYKHQVHLKIHYAGEMSQTMYAHVNKW
jgi:hypothetical protein